VFPSAALGGSTRNEPTTKCRGVVGRDIPRRTDATREASIEPFVAVTGNMPGASPAAVGDGPAIMPIVRGGGASIRIARSLALRGAIATLPFNARPGSLSTRSSKVSGSSPRLVTGMTSLLA